MSRNQEMAWESTLYNKTYAALRVDGKNFTNFTKSMRVNGPFNESFTDRMINVGLRLADEISGSLAVYVQSDEASVIFGDLTNPNSEKWMGGRVQKIASLGAAYASVAFNEGTNDMAVFDGRVFDLGNDKNNAVEYLMERYLSGVKNSVSMYAYSKFSHHELLNVSTLERKKVLCDNGYDWDKNVSERHKYGTLLYRKNVSKDTTFTLNGVTQGVTVQRNVWVAEVLNTTPDFFRYI